MVLLFLMRTSSAVFWPFARRWLNIVSVRRRMIRTDFRKYLRASLPFTYSESSVTWLKAHSATCEAQRNTNGTHSVTTRGNKPVWWVNTWSPVTASSLVFVFSSSRDINVVNASINNNEHCFPKITTQFIQDHKQNDSWRMSRACKEICICFVLFMLLI